MNPVPTDAGSYTFSDVAAGTYTVVAVANGYPMDTLLMAQRAGWEEEPAPEALCSARATESFPYAASDQLPLCLETGTPTCLESQQQLNRIPGPECSGGQQSRLAEETPVQFR